MTSENKVNVLMMGTGEYTTGYVGGQAADSDKGAGVVALTMFDLRRRNKVDRVAMCGVNVSSSLENFAPKKIKMHILTFILPMLGQKVSRYSSPHATLYRGRLRWNGSDLRDVSGR